MSVYRIPLSPEFKAARERFWRDFLAHPWTPLGLGAFLHAWAFGRLYEPLMQGVIFHARRRHHGFAWVHQADQPILFWYNVVLRVLPLILFWAWMVERAVRRRRPDE